MDMKPRIHMVALGVSDIEKSVYFYQCGLGFVKNDDISTESAIFFKTKGIILELFKRANHSELSQQVPDINNFLIAHNVTKIEEINTILFEVKKHGGTILKMATKTPWGGYHGYFSDPDGFCWVITYWDKWVYSEDGALDI